MPGIVTDDRSGRQRFVPSLTNRIGCGVGATANTIWRIDSIGAVGLILPALPRIDAAIRRSVGVMFGARLTRRCTCDRGADTWEFPHAPNQPRRGQEMNKKSLHNADMLNSCLDSCQL
jgi:hypothetical protein